MRFIEFMPLDSVTSVAHGRLFRPEIRERNPCKVSLVGVDVARGSETSSRFRFVDGAPGEVAS